MNVGKMTDARDQVLTTFFSLRLFISSTRPWRRSSMNGPFLIERDMLYLLPLLAMTRSDDESSGRLGPPGPIPHGGLAPRCLGRHPRRGLALATAVRMVSWSRLLTWPIVAMQRSGTRRISPDGIRTVA